MRTHSFRLAVALLATAPVLATAQGAARVDTAALQRILVAEDMRGTGVDGITPLVAGLKSSDTLLRRVAVRAIGRLQRPELGRQLAASLADAVPAVRSEAANAIAQSVSRTARDAKDSGQVNVRWAAGVLTTALNTEQNAGTADAIAEAVGRLPFGDTTTARTAQAAIVAHGGSGVGAMHGLYTLSANRGTTGGLSADGVAAVQRAARASSDPAVRRVAMSALLPTTFVDSVTVLAASRDADEQMRRLALGGVRSLSPATRAAVERAALADPSAIVRIAAIGAVRAMHPGVAVPDCAPIVAATRDPHPYVVVTAINALGSRCADSAGAAAALAQVLFASTDAGAVLQGHALVSFAKLDPMRVKGPLLTFAIAPEPLLRESAARAAAEAGDTNVLIRLTRDEDNNVREAALVGLARVSRHSADTFYIAALTSRGYQVVLAAANALSGTTTPAALPALLASFDRLSAEKRENAKDPRVAVLRRISELGSNANTARLQPYLADFDTTIAATVAATLTKWTGTAVRAVPRPLPVFPEPMAQIFLAKNLQLRVTMVNGGSYTIKLFSDEAPATVARIVRLAREHFYDGHLLQRVEPNFVVQGGGPDGNEYVGDSRFMRDEVTWHSHFRGTLGISSRGRDTGDAQWFFNLIDNTRLDHDYTVFGQVVTGLDVVERIMEGDKIARVEVIR